MEKLSKEGIGGTKLQNSINLHEQQQVIRRQNGGGAEIKYLRIKFNML